MDAEPEFRAYVAGRIAALSRTAYLLTGDWHGAQDLVQLALINVARHWERVSAAGDPDAYVRRVLYNQHVSLWRQRRRSVHLSSPHGPERSPTGVGLARDGADDTATAVVVQAALARLTRKQRAVLVLRFFEDRTETQTAEVLGCWVSTVKCQTRDALARIQVLAPELHELMGKKVPQ